MKNTNKNKLIFTLCSMLLSHRSYAASSSHEADPNRGAQTSTERNVYTTLGGEIVKVNEADYPRLDFDHEGKKIYLIELVKSSKTILTSTLLDYSNPNGYYAGGGYGGYINDEDPKDREESLNAIEFYLKLLEKKIILPEDIYNILLNRSYVLNPDGQILNDSFGSLDSSIIRLKCNHDPRNSLLVEFFCKKGIEEMKTYLLYNNLDVVLPIIEKYIDRVPAISLGIDPRTSLKLLEHNPSWFLSNLDKFYCKAEYRSSIAYSILKDAALKLQNNPDNLEEISRSTIKKTIEKLQQRQD